MMDKSIGFGENSPVKIQVGFLVQIAIILIGMGVGYSAIRSDLHAATEANVRLEITTKEMLLSIDTLRVELARQEIKLDDLKSVYDRDIRLFLNH